MVVRRANANEARSGYTLPVFAVAAAKAALLHLLGRESDGEVQLDLMPGEVTIAIESVARLDEVSALGITRSDPGDGLDITRNTPIWARVELVERGDLPLLLQAGDGVGRSEAGAPAIYRYARSLFETTLLSLIPTERTAIVRVILPEGKALARRTSNEAFGIADGLALLGTSGIAQALTATEKLEEFRQNLREKVRDCDRLVFCLGSNGLRVATGLGIPETAIVMTANWVGAMIADAGALGARSLLLVGYHGKLLKLAGGIFHTSSHVADAKREILCAAVLQTGGDAEEARLMLTAATAEDARLMLANRDRVEPVFAFVAERISANAREYARKYADVDIEIGTVLFDRLGQLVSRDRRADELLSEFHRM